MTISQPFCPPSRLPMELRGSPPRFASGRRLQRISTSGQGSRPLRLRRIPASLAREHNIPRWEFVRVPLIGRTLDPDNALVRFDFKVTVNSNRRQHVFLCAPGWKWEKKGYGRPRGRDRYLRRFREREADWVELRAVRYLYVTARNLSGGRQRTNRLRGDTNPTRRGGGFRHRAWIESEDIRGRRSDNDFNDTEVEVYWKYYYI